MQQQWDMLEWYTQNTTKNIKNHTKINKNNSKIQQTYSFFPIKWENYTFYYSASSIASHPSPPPLVAVPFLAKNDTPNGAQ